MTKTRTPKTTAFFLSKIRQESSKGCWENRLHVMAMPKILRAVPDLYPINVAYL